MKINKIDNVVIDDDNYCKVTKMNNIVEVQYLEKKNCKATIKKLNSSEYVDLKTGKVKKFNKSNIKNNYKSLKATFKNLRYLINTNFSGSNRELFVTLTYAENMCDTNKLMKDVEKFIKKLRYYVKKENVTLEYINVVEPQLRGAWHCHILFKFSKYIFVENSIIENLWGQGYTKTKRIDNVDNIGAYLTAYLCDIEVDENKINTDVDYTSEISSVAMKGCVFVEKENKKFIKGARLHLYPVGLNIYRCSKGIKKPDSEYMLFSEIKKSVVGSAKPRYTSAFEILNEEDEHSNTLIFHSYNLKDIIS